SLVFLATKSKEEHHFKRGHHHREASEVKVDLNDRSLITERYNIEEGVHYLTENQRLIITEELKKLFDEAENCIYSFYSFIPLEEKTPDLSILDGEKLLAHYILENKENEDFSDKLLCLRGNFICKNESVKLVSEGVVIQSKDVDINMAFKALDTIIYRFEILNISSDESELEEAIAQIDGAELEEKGLRYGNYITPANVRCVGVCRKCGKSFVFNTYNYPMGELEPAYSDDGLHTAKLHTAPVDKKNWRITLNGITYRYFNSFCCPHCGGAYIDYKNRNELKRAGNLGCVHFGYKETDITALSELYNEYEY
ncbi:MAG: hypothetical protein IKI34_06010, partial [Eubacterium sp.]|nr:hypothetical protein [Eubacterium sp.]